jgi:hypothetical protein
MPQHNRQTTRKSRRQYLYHDPARFSCSKCKATFRSQLSLKRHRAQLRACQSSSEDEEQSHVQSVANITPLGEASDTMPFVQSELEASSVGVEANPNPEDSAGSDEHLMDIGGDTGEDLWVEDLAMGGDYSFEASEVSNASGAHTTVPSEPLMRYNTIEEVYSHAGKVIGQSNTPYQHISLLPRYQDIKSREQLNQACYPFSNPDEIEVVDWIFSNQLSHASINRFLQMNYVRNRHLSYHHLSYTLFH